jgi:hypothetical protein
MSESEQRTRLLAAERSNEALRNQNELLTNRIMSLNALHAGYRFQISQLVKLLTHTIEERNRLMKGITDGN